MTSYVDTYSDVRSKMVFVYLFQTLFSESLKLNGHPLGAAMVIENKEKKWPSNIQGSFGSISSKAVLHVLYINNIESYMKLYLK